MEDAFVVDREVVFGKMRYGNWREWPLHEQEAVGAVSWDNRGYVRNLAIRRDGVRRMGLRPWAIRR